jgi:hypothetical protein
MANHLITGGTGLVGRALTEQLIHDGHHVTILTRDPSKQTSFSPQLTYRSWDPYRQTIDEQAIREADHVIHLAGANVAEKRWTVNRKKEIVDSRVRSGRFLSACLKNIPNRVSSVVGASAQGWYGPDPSIPNPTPFTEHDPVYSDFLGETCKLWEESLSEVSSLGIRLVQLRIGIVLSTKGGALAEFRKPVRFGITPVLGTGAQTISWIHILDLVSMIRWSIQENNVSGIYNASAPHPVSNKELMQSLAKASGVPFIPIPVPAFALKLLLGEMNIEVLKSTTMSSEKIRQSGFSFQYPEIGQALANLLRN